MRSFYYKRRGCYGGDLFNQWGLLISPCVSQWNYDQKLFGYHK